MSFTDQMPRLATEEDCNGPWRTKKRDNFRCGLCGHRFKPYDIFRWVYANDEHLGNFFVCRKCDGSNVIEKWRKLSNAWRRLRDGKFWYFAR